MANRRKQRGLMPKSSKMLEIVSHAELVIFEILKLKKKSISYFSLEFMASNFYVIFRKPIKITPEL